MKSRMIKEYERQLKFRGYTPKEIRSMSDESKKWTLTKEYAKDERWF